MLACSGESLGALSKHQEASIFLIGAECLTLINHALPYNGRVRRKKKFLGELLIYRDIM